MNKVQTGSAIVGLILLCYIAFSNGFSGPFVFDDIPYLKEGVVLGLSGDLFESNPSRYLTNLSFFFSAAQSFDAPTFHWHNWLLHLYTGAAIFFLTWTLLGKPFDVADGLREKRFWIALTTTAIFLLHPLQTSAVQYAWQRATILAGLTYFTSLACFAWAFVQWHHQRIKPAFFGFFVAWCVGFAAMFTKESAATLFIAMLLISFTVGKSMRRLPLNLWVAFAGLLIIVPYNYLLIRDVYAQMLLEKDGTSLYTPFEYWATQAPVTWQYIRLMVVPLGQNLDYDFQIVQTWTDWRFLMASVGLVLMFALSWFWRSKSQLVFFAVSLFFIVLSVEALAYTLPDIIFEHRTYPAVFCFALALSVGLFSMIQKKHQLLAVVVIYTFALAGLTQYRSAVWQDAVILWSDTVEKSPLKVRPHINLAIAMRQAGNTEGAMTHFTRALELDPANGFALELRGLLYQTQGQPHLALEDYNSAIALDYDTATLWQNRGAIYLELGSPALALSDFEAALEIKPDYDIARFNRALALKELERYEAALPAFLESSPTHTDYAKHVFEIGDIAMKRKAGNMARDAFQRVLEVEPKHFPANLNLGILLSSYGRKKEAIEHFGKMTTMFPEDPRAFMNRGTLHLEQKNYREALADFNAVLQISPNREVLLRRAATYVMLGNRPQARADLMKYRELGGKIPEQLKQMLNL
jgi:tetratricopeptide (TPR) repeat protein